VSQPAAELLDGWRSPGPADYRGHHGMTMPASG
jgi:hypothetical protein